MVALLCDTMEGASKELKKWGCFKLGLDCLSAEAILQEREFGKRWWQYSNFDLIIKNSGLLWLLFLFNFLWWCYVKCMFHLKNCANLVLPYLMLLLYSDEWLIAIADLLQQKENLHNPRDSLYPVKDTRQSKCSSSGLNINSSCFINLSIPVIVHPAMQACIGKVMLWPVFQMYKS